MWEGQDGSCSSLQFWQTGPRPVTPTTYVAIIMLWSESEDHMLAFRDTIEETLWNCGEEKTRGGTYRDTLENKTEFIHRWGKRVVRQSEEGVKVLHLLKCASVKSTIWCSSSFNYLTRLQICHSVMVKRCHPYTFRHLHIQHLESGLYVVTASLR